MTGGVYIEGIQKIFPPTLPYRYCQRVWCHSIQKRADDGIALELRIRRAWPRQAREGEA